jgi:hypothetical protein
MQMLQTGVPHTPPLRVGILNFPQCVGFGGWQALNDHLGACEQQFFGFFKGGNGSFARNRGKPFQKVSVPRHPTLIGNKPHLSGL